MKRRQQLQDLVPGRTWPPVIVCSGNQHCILYMTLSIKINSFLQSRGAQAKTCLCTGFGIPEGQDLPGTGSSARSETRHRADSGLPGGQKPVPPSAARRLENRPY
jgi:hypothetical protein